MGGNFPLIRHNDFQNWVPETDIDGVDAPRNIVSSIKNFDYRHGYIETAGSLKSIALPTNVQTQITAGYSLLSHIYFTHSTQGLTSFSVLWKESATATEKLKCFVNNTELNPDTQNSNVSYSTAPSNINYNVVNDQLKINLNTTATYTTLSKSVILNFTLIYLRAKYYYTALGGPYGRAMGWYLFPRWLGWNYATTIVANTGYDDTVWSFDSDVNSYSGTGVYALSGPASLPVTIGTFPIPISGGRSMGLGYGGDKEFVVTTFYNITHLSFRWALLNPGASTPVSGDSLTITIDDGAGNIIFQDVVDIYTDRTVGEIYTYTANIPEGGEKYLNLRINSTSGIIMVDTFTISYKGVTDYVIVGKYFDGQRALLKVGDSDNPINFEDFQILKSEIDWRLDYFEVYLKDSDSELYYLAGTTDGTGVWGDDSSYIAGSIDLDLTTTTLNFNYNLPATTRVDNQRNIHSEVSHKNRIYFVNGDYKVYQGHISSNLGIQSDAFPYDEEVGFGYFEISHQRINKAVTVSPTNDLVIFTDSGIYVYFIEASSAGAFKQLKMLTGSIGLVSVNSLVKSNSGDPKTDGLFWCDENGIYYYGGGINPPVNLLVGSHEKYWRDSISLSDKQNSVGTYYPKLNEFWLVVGSIIFVFELPYKAFKTYQLSGNPDEFSLASNTLLYCRIDNLLYSYTFTTRSAAEIITHYNTGHNPEIRSNPEVAEIEDKILQEIYMVFGDSDTTTVTMYVYVDDILLGSRIFATSNNTEKWLMDCGIRFNRIKLKVVTTSGLIRIKEFGCSFVPDFKEQLGR